MPAPRLHVTTRTEGDISLTPAQANQLIADGMIHLCDTCGAGTHHPSRADDNSDDQIKDALAALGGTPSLRVFVPLSSAWNY